MTFTLWYLLGAISFLVACFYDWYRGITLRIVPAIWWCIFLSLLGPILSLIFISMVLSEKEWKFRGRKQ